MTDLIARIESADGPDNPAAFPAGWPEAGYEPHYGMTLRDWFAGRALAPFRGGEIAIHPNDAKRRAEMAYQMADAMLAERQKALAAAALRAQPKDTNA